MRAGDWDATGSGLVMNNDNTARPHVYIVLQVMRNCNGLRLEASTEVATRRPALLATLNNAHFAPTGSVIAFAGKGPFSVHSLASAAYKSRDTQSKKSCV